METGIENGNGANVEHIIKDKRAIKTITINSLNQFLCSNISMWIDDFDYLKMIINKWDLEVIYTELWFWKFLKTLKNSYFSWFIIDIF